MKRKTTPVQVLQTACPFLLALVLIALIPTGSGEAADTTTHVTHITDVESQYARCLTIRGQKVCNVITDKFGDYRGPNERWVGRFAVCAPAPVEHAVPLNYDGDTDQVILYCGKVKR